MNIGPLNWRCTPQYKRVTQDAVYGTDVITWTDLPERWCSIVDDKPIASEVVKEGVYIALSRARVQMRYCTDIDASMRLLINRPAPTLYQIIGGPAEIGNHDGLEMFIEKASS